MKADISETAELIALKHTVFALPFAVISLITAADPGWPAPRVWFWVLVAMVSARTAAMAFNRLADHRFDAENPRTASRALPDGRLSRRFVWVVTVFSAAVFFMAAGMLNRFCLALALPTLAILLGYSSRQAIHLSGPPLARRLPRDGTHRRLGRRDRLLGVATGSAGRRGHALGGGF